ncbi:hypothetical protein PRIPAC_75074 [Pristionchus pacificus]|uniref:Uncharacterized protein n=1 Tax=Pristionchus pacificus TaxID=54126 RepID=A0A454XJ81_PRIPA|nr:hypothetical protein PRIPAC_75074 [Pristionchus pacificus]|eukprot:PDM74550.1 hypothetical protein PRIPAC_41906 [Pristionchus pacificus]
MSSSSHTASSAARRPRFKQLNLDPLSRVIYTQAFTALKPLRNAKIEDTKAARTVVVKEHRAQLSTLVSTVSAADAEGLTEHQKLALNLGKVTALFSNRLSAPLRNGVPQRPTVPGPTVAIGRKRGASPAAAPTPEKQIKDEPLDDDEPCSSTIAASTNETLSSLLEAQLNSILTAAVPPFSTTVPRPTTVARPVTVVRRAAPGAGQPPVKVVVANRRNGAAAPVVVAARRPTVPARTTVPANKTTVPANKTTVPSAAPVVVSRPSVNAYRPRLSTGGRAVPGPVDRPTVRVKRPIVPGQRSVQLATLIAEKPSDKGEFLIKGKLSKRLAMHRDACYGILDRDKPEIHPSHACPFCGLMVTGAERQDHVKETHPDQYIEFTPYLCILMECDYRTTSRAAVRKHCMQVHTPLFDKWETAGRLLLDNDTVCPLCEDPIPIRNLRELRLHVKATHDTMPAILCGSCCEPCTSTSELFLHWVNSPFCDGNAKLLDCRQESFLALFA